MSATLFGMITLDGIVMGAIYALSTLGLTMVYGLLRILHIAHAGVYTAGAYVGLWTYMASGNLWLALFAAVLAAALIGLIMERWLYEPLMDKPPMVPMIASIGLFTALGDAFRLIAGPYRHSVQAKLPWDSTIIGGIFVTDAQILILGITAVLLVTVWYINDKTSWGIAWRALADDLEVTAALGVNRYRLVALIFIIGSALAGIAGFLVGVYYNAVYPTMGDALAHKALAIVVLGGLGSTWGAVIAALILGVLESFSLTFLGNLFPPEAIAFLAVILVLVLKPTGLMGAD